MATTIWKFPLQATRQDKADVAMPIGAQIVRLAVQGRVAALWAIVDPEQPTETRTFQVFGTGHPLPPGARYVGSYDAEPFVWHVVELARAAEWQTWESVDDDAPVDGNALVDVRYRDGREHFSRPCCATYWGHTGAADDVVAWRVSESQPSGV
jgi:hypothetical protein